MYDDTWDIPVTIALPKPHGIVTVRTTREAADCLIDLWPEPDLSPERAEALRLCLEVYEDGINPQEARRAFLAAASAKSLRTSI